MNVEVITFNDWKKDKFPSEQVVVTVSKSNNWTKGLSPFVLGHCQLWGSYISKNMENAWQHSKVYPCHLDEKDEIKDEWFEWAKNGWNDSRAYRYPMGKGSIPKFSYWDSERLNYIDARKRIYIPLYRDAVRKTDAWKKLQEMYNYFEEKGKDLYLVDFDAYRHKKLGLSYTQVANDPSRKMGHAFVLACMLECPNELDKITKINKEEEELAPSYLLS
jgi:hypothetical protein